MNLPFATSLIVDLAITYYFREAGFDLKAMKPMAPLHGISQSL
jgi:hypothetical protein